MERVTLTRPRRARRRGGARRGRARDVAAAEQHDVAAGGPSFDVAVRALPRARAAQVTSPRDREASPSCARAEQTLQHGARALVHADGNGERNKGRA